MTKKTALLFLIITLGLLIVPSASLADGSYQVEIEGLTSPKDIEYQGLVPCGKCVDVVGGVSEGSLPEKFADTSKSQCSQTGGTLNQIYVNCQLCHFFIMFNGIISYLLINIIPPVAVLMIVLGGIMFYFGGGGFLGGITDKGGPKLINRGKSLIRGVVIGLLLIYGAYLIVGLFLNVLGVSQWTGLTDWASQGPFSIRCPVIIK